MELNLMHKGNKIMSKLLSFAVLISLLLSSISAIAGDGYLSSPSSGGGGTPFDPTTLTVAGVNLPNAKAKTIIGSNIATGSTVDLYTVPTGRKAYLITGQVYNHAGSSSIVQTYVKISSTYWTLSSSLSVTNASPPSVIQTCFILEAGESLSVSVTASGVNFAYQIIEFDNTATIKSARLFGTTTGINTVYTAGTAGGAILLPVTTTAGIGPGGFAIGTETVATGNYTVYIVPSGQTAGTNFQVSASGIALSTNKLLANVIISSLSQHDAVQFNDSAGDATHWAYINIIERP